VIAVVFLPMLALALTVAGAVGAAVAGAFVHP